MSFSFDKSRGSYLFLDKLHTYTQFLLFKPYREGVTNFTYWNDSRYWNYWIYGSLLFWMYFGISVRFTGLHRMTSILKSVFEWFTLWFSFLDFLRLKRYLYEHGCCDSVILPWCWMTLCRVCNSAFCFDPFLRIFVFSCHEFFVSVRSFGDRPFFC